MLGLPHKQVIQCVVVSDDGDTVSTTSDAGATPQPAAGISAAVVACERVDRTRDVTADLDGAADGTGMAGEWHAGEKTMAPLRERGGALD